MSRIARPALLPLSALALALTLGACTKPDAPQASSLAPASSASAAVPTTNANGLIPIATASASAEPPTNPNDLRVGEPAPDFTTTDQDGKPVHLAELRGHPVVVYFYPKDETPGCTKEACSFRDAWVDLQKKGVVIIGISSDTLASHKSFAENHKLPFTLVSDPKGEIAAKYGVPVTMGYMKRQSFVVGSDGALKKIYRTVDVTKHAQEIAQDTAS